MHAYLCDAAKQSASQPCNLALTCDNLLSDVNAFPIPSTTKTEKLFEHLGSRGGGGLQLSYPKGLREGLSSCLGM